MPASAAQIAANRRNAAASTGPKTEAGKEASRRNALKHGMTGGGVVIPGEDEHEITIRIRRLEAEMAPAGDVASCLLIRQYAMASIRTERAYRAETALAAERMRQAGEAHAERRRTLVGELLAALSTDPATVRRRLLTAPEGIDALLGRLAVLLEKAGPQTFIAWDDAEGAELDRCLGWRPEAELKSRVGLLTRAIVYDHWVGLDPAEYADLTTEARLLWAVGQVRAIIAAEMAALEAHRGTLDLERAERDHAEAGERALLDLGKEGTALRRYVGANERLMLNVLKELRRLRAEAPRAAAAAPGEVVAEVVPPPAPGPSAAPEVQGESGSFGSAPRSDSWARPGSVAAAAIDGPSPAFVPFTIGRGPLGPIPPQP